MSAVETAMSAAFHKAGIKTPNDRLKEIALKAMVEHADSVFATGDAIWSEVQKNRDLLVALFQHAWRREVSALMQRVRSDIIFAERQNALKRPIERQAAQIVALIRRAEDKEEARRQSDESARQAERDRVIEERLEMAWRATKVGSMRIGEKSVWECTAGTVRAWLSTETRRWRTVELLIDGLPDDGRPIGFYRRPDEVEALWRAAVT
jgi:hypothetical protein